MALQIVEACVKCWACQPLCPNEAIVEASPHFEIDPERCTECADAFPVPQCASICPVEGAIVDELGNPAPGSLAAIAAELLAAVAHARRVRAEAACGG